MSAALPGLLLLGCVAVSARPALAQVTLFSDFGPGNSFNQASSGLILGPGTGGYQVYGCEFTPTTSGVINGVAAALSNLGGSTSVGLAILNDNGGTPGSTAFFAATATVPASPAVVTFSSAGGSAVTAGTEYWAVIIPATNGEDQWYANSIGTTGNLAKSNGGAYTNLGPNTTDAFSVSGIGSSAAPEPGSITLLALSALPAAGYIARRRKSA